MNLWAAAEGYAQKGRLRRQERQEIVTLRLRDQESAKTTPPPKPANPLEINQKPYLETPDTEGWVTASEDHHAYLRWSKYYPVPTAKTNKQKLERLVTEAALKMGQNEVEIRYLYLYPFLTRDFFRTDFW